VARDAARVAAALGREDRLDPRFEEVKSSVGGLALEAGWDPETWAKAGNASNASATPTERDTII